MSWSIDIISCITDRFVELTATEKRIAQFILDDVAAAAELPIAEIARLTQTSQASVTRFARALGCKDVRELKMKLAQSLAVGQRLSSMFRISKASRGSMSQSSAYWRPTGGRWISRR